MTDIAVLTPDPGDELYQSRWREVLERLAGPLRKLGARVVGRSWTDAGDLSSFDLVLPLLTWGYHRAGHRWARQIDAWDTAGVRLRNPASVLRWNADKRYLGRLAERGAPVVPTLFVDCVTETALADAAERFGSDTLIAKPQVSAGAWQTIRWSPGAPLDAGPTGPAMIQPFLPSVQEQGEISLIHVDGRFSHAIRKRPKPGDFRVQPEYGALITAHEPTTDEREAAEAVLATIDESLLYARVDLIRSQNGQPVLMEIELVEPDLYLDFGPSAGANFAAAVMAAA